MANERKGAATLKGNPLTLVGPELKAGDKAPDATLMNQDLKDVKLSDFKGKVRLLNVLFSVDTGICDAQTKRFDEEVAKLGNVEALTISMDLPFNQKRYCGASGVKHALLSDAKSASFAEAYGVLIKELRLTQRAVFVVKTDGTLAYAGVNKEVAEPPNYDEVLAALKAAA